MKSLTQKTKNRGNNQVSRRFRKYSFQSDQSYSYIMRKVWYHQIWIQNYLGFIVSDLMYMLYAEWEPFEKSCQWNLHIKRIHINQGVGLYLYSLSFLLLMRTFLVIKKGMCLRSLHNFFVDSISLHFLGVCP